MTPGTWLGDWLLDARIGEGGFSVVHRAKQAETGQEAAIKVLTDPRMAERLRTGRKALTLDHERIVKTLEDGLDHDPPFLALALVEGRTLRDALNGAQPLAFTRSVVDALAQALDYAHDEGALHLDVKPENVLLDASDRVFLTDFGAVSGADDDGLRQSLLLSKELGVAGTPDYSAPEVRCAEGLIDRRADVYGLAVVAFELLTGRLPLGLDRPCELNPELPPAVDAVLARALTRDPKRRTLSAGAFAAELTEALSAVATAAQALRPAGPESPPPPPSRAPRSRFLGALAAAAGLAFAISLLALGQTAAKKDMAFSRRAKALLKTVPPAERVGLLLPVEDLGAPERGWARDGRALADAFLPERVVAAVYTPGGQSELYERAPRNVLASSSGCTYAIHAVLPADAGRLEDDALLFLIDLSSYEIRAASVVTEVAALDVAHFVRSALPSAAKGPLVVLPTIDAKLRVASRATAELDARITAALVNRTERVRVRARAGLVPRLRGVNGGVTRALSANLVVQCVYDEPALRVEVRHADGTAIGHRTLTLTPPLRDYDPERTASAFTVDAHALSLLGRETPADVVDEALRRARAHLYQREASAAEAILETLLARADKAGEPKVEPLLLLAESRRAQGDTSGALEAYAQALKVDANSADVQLAYARTCLSEATRLFQAGKRPWYADDDERAFVQARDLLQRVAGFEQLDPPLSAELQALRARLDREL